VADIVIGSGPAGVAAASALLARGREVLMLDAGLALEPERHALRERLAAREPHDWRDSERAALWPARSEQSDLMRPFGSDFPFRDPVGFFGPIGPPRGIDLRPSFATGGLSNGWGASVLPYRSEDIADWPIGTEDLAPHYQQLREFVPIAATRDDLAALFPALAIAQDSGLAPSSQAEELLRRLARHRDRLREAGLHFGRARVAAHAPSCRRCRMCLHGCPYGAIYSASATVTELLRNDRFRYRRGWHATRFEEAGGRVRLRGTSLADGSVLEASGERLFVACGVLPTARLVLASLERFDAPLRLLDSQHCYLPMLHGWSPSPDPADEPLHTLTQAFLELIDPEIDRHTVHVQLYTHNDFYAADMRKRFGAAAGLVGPLIAQLSRRLIVAQAFLHSDVSPEMRLTLLRTREGEYLQIGRCDNPAATATLRRVRRRLFAALRRVGLWPLLPLTRTGAVGSSFHCGGSFPMRAAPSGLESDVLGRPAGLARVHLVDASVFPSIPATTITLSVMANAHRIATRAEQELPLR
jgi:choline dehydrogenase-like flavoprotein